MFKMLSYLILGCWELNLDIVLFICLFVFKENYSSYDQKHSCEAIHQLAGLVRWNGGQCLLKKGGLIDDTTLISTAVVSMVAEGI